MPKLKVITYGCQANELDSARIAGLLILRDGTLPFPNGHATFGRHEAP